ncbi:MAG: response regulator [Proteobacteria bacterium]|nr:response regulator [Pseudomonadota bacterium]MBU1233535.1 response regulator [Pseudomonadota bacterium]MBU1418660.1 response regulator [Pseudomonadota bacterium]
MKSALIKFNSFCFKQPAFKVSFIYAVFSVLWILFSDQILFWFVKDPEVLTSIQMLKGWLFVIVTSIIIFLLLSKEISRLKDAENVLLATLHSTADGILVVSNEGQVIATNSKFAAMWSIPPVIITDTTRDQELIEYILTQLEDPEKFCRRVDELYRSSADGLDEICLKDGRLFERYTTPLIQNDIEIGRVWSFHDLTERKNAKAEKTKLEERLQQSQKMEAIGTLAGGIAHDFNNILTVIFGYAELAKDDATNYEDLQKDLDEVLHSAERAKELVMQILTFSRRSEQKLKPLKAQVIIEEALKLLRSSLPTTIAIKTNINQACPAVIADATQLHQIVMNVCTNAYHAMREKGGELSVSLQPIELTYEDVVNKRPLPPGSYIKLSISDTGIGMTNEVLSRIFEPYYTTKAKGEGTGLGLAVVHGIVSSYHGDINVYSEPGKGTTFNIYLPNATSSAEIISPEKISPPLPTGNERVLLVDDDEMIAKMNKKMLEKLGYQTTVLTNSLETLAAFQKNPDKFDLLITDMTMPNMTGAELTRRILAIRSDLPIILCTGYSDLINEEKAKAIGVSHYVMKPVIMKDLANVVRKALDES